MKSKRLTTGELLLKALPENSAIANRVSSEAAVPRPRPKVGEGIDTPFDIPDSAFAPLTDEELKEWGL